jgi:hypothetical protein
MNTMRRINPILLAALAAAALSACGPLNDPRGPYNAFDGAQVINDGNSEKAMNYLARGDYPNAERYAIAVLRAAPKDPYALYVAGMVYQATGRYDLARQYYEVILANQPQVTITVLADGTPQVRTLMDVAQANLLVIDKITGRKVPRTAAQSGRPVDVPPQLEPLSPLTPSRGAISAQQLDAGGAAMAAAPSQGEANATNRFRILKRLLDEGLITPDEFTRRRSVNRGALLPYSSSVPPAQGLDRPGPTDAQVVDRLKELARALETRAMSPSEHAAERQVILEALLPAEPRRVDLPVLPPKDVMEAATAVGRVERLRASGLVSAEEAKKERDSIERLLDSQLSKVPVSGSATGLRQGAAANGGAKAAKGAGIGNGTGIALGWGKSEADAQASWEKIKGKFPEELGSVGAQMRAVEGDKGTRWRIVAGPFANAGAARNMCKVLKLHRQSCDQTGF